MSHSPNWGSRMNRPYSLAIFCVFGLIVGCVGLSKRDPGPVVINQQNVERLYGMEWQLRSITVDGNNVVMHVDAAMTLRFDADGQVHGYGAVNRFSGGYRFDSAGALSWSVPGFVVAKKAGPPELLEKERIFLDALKHSNRAILGKSSLILQTDDGNTVITFLKPGVL